MVTMIQVLEEYERGVVFRLGRALPRPKGPGLIILLPFGIDRMRKVSVQTVAINVPPQDILTKDNWTIRVDMVIRCQVVDPFLAVVRVHDYLLEVQQAAQTNLRAILGKYDLDTLLSEGDNSIKRELHQIIGRVTVDWGVGVVGVETMDVHLPEDLRQAMAREAEAEADARLKWLASVTGGPGSLVRDATRDVEAKSKQEAVEQQSRQIRAPNIFLSYRREDTQWVSRTIYESLSAKFGDEHIFRDIDSISAGTKYSILIETKIAQCNVMIVLIGNAWSSAKDEAGRRRLELPKDWVRREIEEALRQKIPIIPVCMEGARMPSEDELPSSIAGLAGFQSTEITDRRWDSDVERLLQAIDRLIPSSDQE